jgi:hypothetical protein
MGILDDSNAYVDFLVKNKLSTNQFLLLYLLYTEKMLKVNNQLKFKKIGNIYKWSEEGTGWSEKDIEDLIKKDFIFGVKGKHIDNQGVESYKYFIDQLLLTQKFSDLMFINANFALEEILEIYPDTINVNGSVYFTKNGDLDKIALDYCKLIKNNIHKHEEIKAIVIYAKERGLCNTHISKFLSKGTIESIKKMMEESYETGNDV